MSVLKTFLTLSLLALCVSCTTYYVSPFGNDNNSGLSTSSPLRTVSRGVNKASFGELVLMSGVYSGAGNSGITVSSTITITAQANVFLTCQQTANTFAFSLYPTSLTFTMSNFTIRDCKTALAMPTSSYIRTAVVSKMLITNVDLAFENQMSNLTLDNVQVSNTNKGIQQYGGRSYLTIRNSVFLNITGSSVFANSCYDTISVTNTLFDKATNSAINTACDLSINNGTFSNIKGYNGAAIWANSSTTIQIVNSLFTYNTATNIGGAILAEARVNVAISGSSFTGNSAAFGGAIYSAGTMNIVSTDFSYNKATTSGGGFECNNGQNLLTNVNFVSNSAPTGSAFDCNSCVTYVSGVNYSGGNTPNCPIINNFVLEPEHKNFIANALNEQ
eukprot:TRINITY_DN145_c0_g2_i1.p1 TRINITY_DN145_c0_g2~~TRINITY_DN145_c0_g2_i1.p1  ORF type:complete len:398 (+),score=219.28 TRINITY_DN145_c0_g2_i1:31-1194(+)